MNGNVTQEGIRLDLEWMKRVGIGGFQAFDASRNTPSVVKQRLVFMTPPWRDAFRFATTEADRLGLEMAIAGSPGWSESGGPWVKPAEAMKKLVWSETVIEGGTRYRARLPAPPDVTGPFQSVPYSANALTQANTPQSVRFYRDAHVIAFRQPDAEWQATQARATVTSSTPGLPVELLQDGDLAQAVELPIKAGEEAWIEFRFDAPRKVSGLSYAMAGDNWARPMNRRAAPPLGELQASDDGTSYRLVAVLPGFDTSRATAAQHTIALPEPVTARYFRMSFANPPQNADYRTALMPATAPEAKLHRIVELTLRSGATLHRFEEKAGFGTVLDYDAIPTPAASATGAVPRAEVIDVTAQMASDGTLDWTPPPGRWVVQRFGYSLIGTTNHPASPEATGLEVDKLNREHVRSYVDQYLGQYARATGGLMGAKGLQYMIIDSWEAGVSNWTERMREEFGRRNGYDLVAFLPTLTGRVVGDPATSDRFLWDFRKTIGDLAAENHHGYIASLLKERGMGLYAESLERERPTLGDGMAFKRHADIPMGAFWTRRAPNEPMPNYGIDLRESASVAHVYGQNLVAAESLTANMETYGWIDSPRTLKPVADEMMALGVNRFVIHTSVHQPLVDEKPGLTLGIHGQHFTRNETWAEQAGSWVSYLARSSHLLQQGRFVADIAYFYGEEAPITALFSDREATPPEIPPGHAFDFVNVDALTSRLRVENGKLVTDSGGRYSVLYLGGSSARMTLAAMRRIQALANAGAAVVGSKPVASPSLRDDPREVQALADELWGQPDGPGVRAVGRGRIYSGFTIKEALTALQVDPDFDFDDQYGNLNLLHVHRQLADGDLYFVTNRNDRAADTILSLRVVGHGVELWDPASGRREPAAYTVDKGRTRVTLKLAPHGSAFVVLKTGPGPSEARLAASAERHLTTFDGPWTVRFPPGRGAPDEQTFARLMSWSESGAAGVRYFSGTAVYSKAFTLEPGAVDARDRVLLDLGELREVADVVVNGTPVATLWSPPYRTDITRYLKVGANQLEVRVTNLWVNRIIGDLQPGTARKVAFIVVPVYQADSPLLPSGLLGPVTLNVVSPIVPSR